MTLHFRFKQGAVAVSYAIRYLRRAREEADHLRMTYGQNFAQAFDQWLVSLAETAEKGGETPSVDALEILEEAMEQEGGTAIRRWNYSWDRFKSAGGLEKLRALLVVLRKRCPPWEFRMTSNWFALLDCIAVEIQSYYVIDRPNKRIIFQLFEMDYPRSELS